VASFITTDEQLQLNRGCCFLVQAMLPEGFPFHQFNIRTLIGSKYMYDVALQYSDFENDLFYIFCNFFHITCLQFI